MARKNKRGNDSSDNEIRYYLESYGIHSLSEDIVVDPEHMAELGYKEVPNSHVGQIGLMFQQLPGLASHAISYHGTYRVYFDKSLGVLQQAKQGNGFLRVNVVQAGTNNKITGQALLKAASAGPLVANAVFSALSMITGQYFLSEINGKLSQIEKKIDSIQQFLENEKRSELLANYYFLQQTIQTFEFIQSNDLQKQAVIQQLQRIRIDSYANLNFYSTSFQQKKTELRRLKSNEKSNIKKIPCLINELGDIVILYKFALYTYSLAYYLEIMLSGNMDSKYIKFVKKDIKGKTADYKALVKYFSDEMIAFFDETKAYNASVFLDICANIVVAGASQLLLGSPTLGILISDAISSNSEEKKKSARNEVVKQVNALLKQCSEYAPFTKIETDLTNYDKIINNSSMELVCSDDKTYIKFSNIEDEEIYTQTVYSETTEDIPLNKEKQTVIGLKRNTVKLFPHQTEWERNAEKVMAILRQILGDTAVDIQHIGSTAIRHIHAKPIIDIAVGVENTDDILQFEEELSKNGIICRGEDIKGQLLYVICDFENDTRTHNIHVLQYNSTAWNNYILFRDYLNQNPDEASIYDTLKKRLAGKFPDDLKAYTDGKSEFINQLLKKALVEFCDR